MLYAFAGHAASSAQETPGVEVTAPAPSCPRCQYANLPEAQFCNGCGASLVVACPSCERANPPGAAFCHACATPLNCQTPVPTTAADALPEQEPEAPPSPEAERRHLTQTHRVQLAMRVAVHTDLGTVEAMEARNIGLEQERQLRLAVRIDARSTANAGGEVDETCPVRY